MSPFTFIRAADKPQALAEMGRGPQVKFLAGGTNLIDLMKVGVERPSRLVDIHRLPEAEVQKTAQGIRIGALAKNSDVANHVLIRTHCPLLSQSLLSGASPQLRNMATIGGNLMQRTRCWYFYDGTMPCNKRMPGTGCAALEGINRQHAIFGASDACVAVHPSDMCVALAALDAEVEVEGPEGTRKIAFQDFHRLPGDTPEVDTNLREGEMITSVLIASNRFTAHSCYVKVRERSSYEFALVSAAVAFEMDGDTLRSARIALGGVAHKPWRVAEAEAVLTGQRPGASVFMEAAQVAVRGARPLTHNAFKVDLARRTIARALALAWENGVKN